MFRWELIMLSVVSGLFILMLDPARIWENEIFLNRSGEIFLGLSPKWESILLALPSPILS